MHRPRLTAGARTEAEVTALIAQWIQQHSVFTATVKRVVPQMHGTWVAEVECGGQRWRQTVSPAGEVSAPVWLD
jgi:hypothetical protein